MKHRSARRWARATRKTCVAAVLCLAAAAHAQTANRSIGAKPPPPAPTAAQRGGLPQPAGLSLTTTAPATTDPGSDTTAVTVIDSAGNAVNVQLPNTALSGGPGALAGAGRATPAAGGGYSAQEVASSFMGADVNRDGQLTRGEAQRLTIAPYSFDEMDANHDGILTRSEYADGIR